MAFDWLRFFDRHNIEWSDKGGGTKNNVTIHCPWCGSGDSGLHLSVSLEGRGYRCLRAPRQHRGRSVPRLIQALLGCAWEEALRLAGYSARAVLAEGGLEAALNKLKSGGAVSGPDVVGLGWPIEFRPLTDWGSGRRFVDYLVDERGYAYEDIDELQKRYYLNYAISGPFKWRLIFPVFMHGKLVNWTGRTLAKYDKLRYRTLSANAEEAKESRLPVAALSIEKTLWNYDELRKGGRKLILVEGPFDAMRLDYFGRDYQVRASCTWTKAVSDDQLILLSKIRDRFDEFERVLDADAELDLLGEQRRMAHLDCSTRKLPSGFDDPAKLTRDAALEFVGA